MKDEEYKMKEYKVVVNQVRTVDMKVRANSDKEAERKIKDIIESTNLLSKCEADETVLVKAFTEGERGVLYCDADCEHCPFDDEEECLYDELY